MTTVRTAQPTTEQDFESAVRARINSLSYLPTTMGVAMKFVELGRDHDAEPVDYARIVSSDSSLSSKILAMANSSWAGVRNKVTNVKSAVNLLGLGTVRTLAISYCMTGLHNELKLSAEESELFWESSLCKAVAAKTYMLRFNKKKADEAFAAGLFQDFALPVMYSIGRERYLQLYRDPQGTGSTQRKKERELFNMDHAEVGRALAQRLELPDLFVDAVAFHHDFDRVCELLEDQRLAEAVYAASLLPHLLNVWHRKDANALGAFVAERGGLTGEEYLGDVQREFEQMYKFFNDGAEPNTRLNDLMERVSRELADNTVELVNTVNEFMRQAAAAGVAVHELANQNDRLEDKARHDPLTGVLNREAFMEKAGEATAKAARYRVGFSVAYFDVDKFKSVNDTFGHDVGDAVLKLAADAFKGATREQDFVGRLGGDEFVLFLHDYTAEEARRRVEGIVASVAANSARLNDTEVRITLSAGLLHFERSDKAQQLEIVIKTADRLMYQAKRAGGNRVEASAPQS